MSLNALRQWLRDIRDGARGNAKMLDIILDTQPPGVTLHDTDTVVEVVAKEDPTPNRLEIELILAGTKIHAIKEHRARTGLGLKESKDAIDAWCEKIRLTIVKSGNTVESVMTRAFPAPQSERAWS